ncbi:hypothetical protein PAXRUDRAFT_202193 [Paxillus rubicundulus Ve08.2h10]|uniref:Uncharacterized protein n=1 Tax=Paxillus rubicundulus Ve08.2h10 TaxID=930991 RepID=A0A0D0CZK2_9AGAM|nr:hypothetical protein PAXRUDRAFT_202193 [Paxillus rubicundulus Ve08.2h10]
MILPIDMFPAVAGTSNGLCYELVASSSSAIRMSLMRPSLAGKNFSHGHLEGSLLESFSIVPYHNTILRFSANLSLTKAVILAL